MDESKNKLKRNKAFVIFISVCLLFALILGAALLFLYSYSSSVEKQQQLIKYELSAVVKNGTDEITINSWKNPKDKKNYFFMPEGADLSSVEIRESDKTDGDFAEGSLETGENTIEVNNKKYDIVVMQSKNIPAVYINTESGSMDTIYSDKSEKESAVIQVYDNIEKLVDEKLKHIKGRGNASWEYPQKSFNIKFENKFDLFGMGEGKKYSLISTYTDQTLIKNNLAFTLADNIGLNYVADYQQVDLYINNNYFGNYLVTEGVRVGKNRININNLDDENEYANSGVNLDELDILTDAESINDYSNGTKRWVDIENNPENITHGYLLELELGNRYIEESSGFVTGNGQAIVVSSPEYATEEEVSYISSFYQKFENALLSDDGYNEDGKHYSEYIDISSFAKMYLVQEFSSNRDANLTSTYMYLDDSGILKAGPVWDFDNSFGNQVYLGNMNDPSDVKPYEFNVCNDGFFNQLCSKSDFRKAVYEIWNNEVRDEAEKLIDNIEADNLKIFSSAVMNSVRWNRYNTTVISENADRFNDAHEQLKDFILKRIELFDNSFDENSSLLNYNSNGEGNSVFGEGIVKPDEKQVIKENMFTSSKNFICWNTKPDGTGTSYYPNDEASFSNSSVTLYAQWSDKESAVKKIKNKINFSVSKIKNSLNYRIKVITG
ncbi:MAG: CotH kinase family protein [Acetobacter sp.]|nr:CotH kinase family protein [Bacteroides sp.]MCM1341738.1 CotH kinase family protein [Acetobacter sp.]MCM1432323.1 CotH kinase family protein [Clostridiales bacterium]